MQQTNSTELAQYSKQTCAVPINVLASKHTDICAMRKIKSSSL